MVMTGAIPTAPIHNAPRTDELGPDPEPFGVRTELLLARVEAQRQRAIARRHEQRARARREPAPDRRRDAVRPAHAPAHIGAQRGRHR